MSNDFIDVINMPKPMKTSQYIILKTRQELSVSNLHKRIDNDFPPINRGQSFNTVYCYSLAEGTFKYPNGESNVLYIGETEGEINNHKKRLGFRFKHCMSGKDAKINECLKYHYNSDVKLVLEIFNFSNNENRKEIEKNLRNSFLQKYAALPIADGASKIKEN